MDAYSRILVSFQNKSVDLHALFKEQYMRLSDTFNATLQVNQYTKVNDFNNVLKFLWIL